MESIEKFLMEQSSIDAWRPNRTNPFRLMYVSRVRRGLGENKAILSLSRHYMVPLRN